MTTAEAKEYFQKRLDEVGGKCQVKRCNQYHGKRIGKTDRYVRLVIMPPMNDPHNAKAKGSRVVCEGHAKSIQRYRDRKRQEVTAKTSFQSDMFAGKTWERPKKTDAALIG